MMEVEKLRSEFEFEGQEVDVEELTKKFPEEAHKHRPGPGKSTFTYVEGHTVINRLNEATGNRWSFEIIQQWVDGDIRFCWGRLVIPGLGHREDIGVVRAPLAGGEDLQKGHVTDCLKRCARLFGVGIELYGEDYEADPLGGKAPAPKPITNIGKPKQQATTKPVATLKRENPEPVVEEPEVDDEVIEEEPLVKSDEVADDVLEEIESVAEDSKAAEEEDASLSSTPEGVEEIDIHEGAPQAPEWEKQGAAPGTGKKGGTGTAKVATPSEMAWSRFRGVARQNGLGTTEKEFNLLFRAIHPPARGKGGFAQDWTQAYRDCADKIEAAAGNQKIMQKLQLAVAEQAFIEDPESPKDSKAGLELIKTALREKNINPTAQAIKDAFKACMNGKEKVTDVEDYGRTAFRIMHMMNPR